MCGYLISLKEYESRIERLKNELQKRNFVCMFLTKPIYLSWLTSFTYYPSERFLGLLVPVEGDPTVVLPKLEELHWRKSIPWINDIVTYLDYPGNPHCYNTVTNLIIEHGYSNKKIAIDGLGMVNHAPKPMLDTFKTLYGHGPSFKPHLEKTLPEAKFENKEEILVKWMLILSDADKQQVREESKWADLAHKLMLEKVLPGRNHWEISYQASLEASKIMSKTLDLKQELHYMFPARANFFAGPATAFGHSGLREDPFRKIKTGDNCVSYALANIIGVGPYGTEIERTFFVGEPNDLQKKLFRVMIRAQDAAFNAIKPGVKCSEVCKASYKLFKEEGVWDLVYHHVGHGKPWLGHLPPYFDLGDNTILKPNMEFSIEPGLYVKELGGFRHSDTIFVTDDSAEWVTNKTPRDLENNTLKI